MSITFQYIWLSLQAERPLPYTAPGVPHCRHSKTVQYRRYIYNYCSVQFDEFMSYLYWLGCRTLHQKEKLLNINLLLGRAALYCLVWSLYRYRTSSMKSKWSMTYCLKKLMEARVQFRMKHLFVENALTYRIRCNMKQSYLGEYPEVYVLKVKSSHLL